MGDGGGQKTPGDRRGRDRRGRARSGGWLEDGGVGGEAYKGCGTEAYGESRRHGGNIQL